MTGPLRQHAGVGALLGIDPAFQAARHGRHLESMDPEVDQIAGATLARDLLFEAKIHGRPAEERRTGPVQGVRTFDILRGELLGVVFAATEKAACVRAIQRWKIRGQEDGWRWALGHPI